MHWKPWKVEKNYKISVMIDNLYRKMCSNDYILDESSIPEQNQIWHHQSHSVSNVCSNLCHCIIKHTNCLSSVKHQQIESSKLIKSSNEVCEISERTSINCVDRWCPQKKARKDSAGACADSEQQSFHAVSAALDSVRFGPESFTFSSE